MYMAYNKELRILSENRDSNKHYVTTIHAIVSGIIKLVCVCVCVCVLCGVCLCVPCDQIRDGPRKSDGTTFYWDKFWEFTTNKCVTHIFRILADS